MTIRGTILWLCLAAGLTATEAASAPAPLERKDKETVQVREGLDGAGPSHLIARGRALIVLDPNRALLMRYPLNAADGVVNEPTACALPRAFSPRFVQPAKLGLRIIGEDPSPEVKASNAFLPVLDISDARLTTLARHDPKVRPEPCGEVIERATRIPIEVRREGSAWRVSPVVGFVQGPKGGVKVGPNAKAELFNARTIGRTDNLGVAILRREIVRGDFGRVNVALWVTLIRDSRTTSVRLYDHAINASGKVTGLLKRGFEYAAVTGHSLYVLGTTCPGAVCIERFDLAEVPPGDGVGNNWTASIDLSGGEPQRSEDAGLDGSETTAADTAASISPGGRSWNDWLVKTAGEYAFTPWTYPADRRTAPCGEAGPDQCRVKLRNGLLVDASTAQATDTPVTQVGDRGKDALWVGPRHLIDAGVLPSRLEHGVPYSFGGKNNAETFRAALKVSDQRPIGHIRDSLNGVDGAHYPLGLDCSRFVGFVLGILLGTDNWIDTPPPTSKARFVNDLRNARPGDILVKRGHIVIFNRRVASRGSLAVEVFESASRCGRVCRSVYDPDFFNGWRIMRVRQAGRDDAGAVANPYWAELDDQT